MKTREIYKVNGKTFNTYPEVAEYCESKKFHITSVECTFEKRLFIKINWVNIQQY